MLFVHVIIERNVQDASKRYQISPFFHSARQPTKEKKSFIPVFSLTSTNHRTNVDDKTTNDSEMTIKTKQENFQFKHSFFYFVHSDVNRDQIVSVRFFLFVFFFVLVSSTVAPNACRTATVYYGVRMESTQCFASQLFEFLVFAHGIDIPFGLFFSSFYVFCTICRLALSLSRARHCMYVFVCV